MANQILRASYAAAREKKAPRECGLDRGQQRAWAGGQDLSALGAQTRPAPVLFPSKRKGERSTSALVLATLQCRRAASRRVRLRVGAVSLNASSPPSKAVRFRAAVVRPDRRCARRFEEVIKSLRNCRDFEQSGREVYA
jgi:mRNA-degrading endonuclease toxin of MazEF toxin-antitoxin module